MFNFFDTIFSFLKIIVTFIGHMILTVMFVIDYILEGVVYVFACIAYLPPWITPFIFAVIGFSVVMFLINR